MRKAEERLLFGVTFPLVHGDMLSPQREHLCGDLRALARVSVNGGNADQIRFLCQKQSERVRVVDIVADVGIENKFFVCHNSVLSAAQPFT